MKTKANVDAKNPRAQAPKRRYTLAESLAQCEGGPLTPEDREWLAAPDVGRGVRSESEDGPGQIRPRI